jgi:hypothetical protein
VRIGRRDSSTVLAQWIATFQIGISIPKFIKYERDARTPYITIANIGAGSGQDQTRIMDVKIGTATVSKKELMASGMGWWSAWKKKRKLEIALRDSEL